MPKYSCFGAATGGPSGEGTKKSKTQCVLSASAQSCQSRYYQQAWHTRVTQRGQQSGKSAGIRWGSGTGSQQIQSSHRRCHRHLRNKECQTRGIRNLSGSAGPSGWQRLRSYQIRRKRSGSRKDCHRELWRTESRYRLFNLMSRGGGTCVRVVSGCATIAIYPRRRGGFGRKKTPLP